MAAMAPPAPSPDAVPGWVRPFLYGVVVLLLVCALAGLEWWPFTGFRLFSQVRSSTDVSYEVRTVTHGGVEQSLNFGSYPPSFRQYSRLLVRMADLTTAERNRICQAWATGAAKRGVDVAQVRIYRVVRPVPRRPHQHPAPVSQTVRWTCEPPA